ncbi:cilia- and flagella-associated protein 61-like [Pseudomyrmex gracilis]|uniref:cilia- and flagella-associated protein 61-like n=1 Tax=Pseudomyrmex gracilis TaxID=219809 RepID=UPI000994F8C8|nr:cilia- and flagella-associated protein 61-like [Pseudomyrmex gracilis]
MSTSSNESDEDFRQICGKKLQISGYRRAEHSDLVHLDRLIRPATYEIFGDVNVGRVYETSCLSMVQHNERYDIISGICLCNYPNVSSVPTSDWLTWLKTLYGISTVTERNTKFVHFLAWDERYTDEFLKELLIAVFDITVYCQHVILVIPPRVTPADVFEREMTRILPENTRDTDAPQFLYLIDRYRLCPKLRIRKVVEEDNDDVIEIINGERAQSKELYGDYYVSEIIRYPDGRRQLIVGEDADGTAQGVACLTSKIDVDTLNENFELTPYNGLRRPHESDDATISVSEVITELLRSVFSREYTPRFDRSAKYNASSRATKEIEDEQICEVTSEKSIGDVIPRRLMYRGEANAFIMEILAMREPARPHWSHDFLEAAFDCFPCLEYCAILLPSSHPCYQYLQYFTRVPLRYNKDFPMSLYVVHRAALREKIECRRAQARDREAVKELLSVVSTKQLILTDFDHATDRLQLDFDCFIFECNDTILGLAILRAEKQANRIRSHHHIEDYVSVRNIPHDGYGCLLHFVLTPIFYTHHSFFFCEIARLSELTVIFSRLHHQDESTSTSLASCLDSMIPVNPRGSAEYEFPISPKHLDTFGNDINDEVNDNRFSLFVTSPRLATMPRVNIDTKIVIVGASDCGIAFAEHLALR